MRGLICLGGALLFAGWALAFLTVIRILAPSFLVAFIAAVFLIVGTAVGFFGIFAAHKGRRDGDR